MSSSGGFDAWGLKYPEILKTWSLKKNLPVVPSDLTHGSRAKVWWTCEKNHSWETTLPNRIKGYGCPYCSNKKTLPGFNDLSTTHSHLVEEWHGTLNGPLVPTQFVAGSKKPIWWVCTQGHEWKSTIANRAQKGSGCLVCTLRIVVKGVNDLATTNPDLAKEWNTEKNKPLTVGTVSRGYAKRVWWVCPKGHESFLSPHARSRKSSASSCQTCANKILAQGENDLASTNPGLAMEWNHSRNFPLLPSEVFSGAGKPYWWICRLGHEWKAPPSRRTTKGNGCPVCSKKIFTPGQNDLATTHPVLVREWDLGRNHPIEASHVTSGSQKKVWWICERSHSFAATPAARVHRNSGCPYCEGGKALEGFNDLGTTHPEIARQLVDELNNGTTYKDVTAGSRVTLYWRCPKGHITKKDVKFRVNTQECPVCSNYQLLVGYNDLETVNPRVIQEWDSKKNAPLKPSGISAFTYRRVWWICSLGHSHRQGVRTKAIQDNGCPVCAGKQVLIGFNDLASQRPDIAELWDQKKNLEVKPNQVTVSSNKRVWWTCDKNHSWQGSIANISSGSRCPRCAPGGFDQTQPGVLYFIENLSLNARKIGITNQGIRTDRLKQFSSLGWNEISVFSIDDGAVVREIESAILNWVRKDCGLPPYLGRKEMGNVGGWSETFSSEGPRNSQVVAKIQELIEKTSSQTP